MAQRLVPLRFATEAGRLESVMLCLPNAEARYFLATGWTADSASRSGNSIFGAKNLAALGGPFPCPEHGAA